MTEQAFVENLFLTLNLALIVAGLASVAWVISNTELTVGKGILLFMVVLVLGSIHVSYKSPDGKTESKTYGPVNKETLEKLE